MSAMSEAFRKLEDNRHRVPLKDYYTEDRLASLLPHERARIERLIKHPRSKGPRKSSTSQLTPEQQQQQQQRQQQHRAMAEARAAAESARLTALGSTVHPSLVRQPPTLARGAYPSLSVSTQTIVQKLDVIIQKLNQLVAAENRKSTPYARRGGKRKTKKSRKKRRKGKTKRRR